MPISTAYQLQQSEQARTTIIPFVCGASQGVNRQNQQGQQKRPCPKFTQQTKIGSTLYRVGVFFDEEATETMQDKVLRLVKSEVFCGESRENPRNDLTLKAERATMESPQTGRLLEGGSL